MVPTTSLNRARDSCLFKKEFLYYKKSVLGGTTYSINVKQAGTQLPGEKCLIGPLIFSITSRLHIPMSFAAQCSRNGDTHNAWRFRDLLGKKITKP
jgi:hypothetical protein